MLTPLIFAAVFLLKQHLVLLIIPSPRPCLVSPADAIFYVDLRVIKQYLHRTLHELMPREVILIEGKTVDPVFLCLLRLYPKPLPALVGKIIIIPVIRHSRLYVSLK